jgi:hypothetical protein
MPAAGAHDAASSAAASRRDIRKDRKRQCGRRPHAASGFRRMLGAPSARSAVFFPRSAQRKQWRGVHAWYRYSRDPLRCVCRRRAKWAGKQDLMGFVATLRGVGSAFDSRRLHLFCSTISICCARSVQRTRVRIEWALWRGSGPRPAPWSTRGPRLFRLWGTGGFAVEAAGAGRTFRPVAARRRRKVMCSKLAIRSSVSGTTMRSVARPVSSSRLRQTLAETSGLRPS